MIPIAVTQRIVDFPDVGERRDCLDRRWTEFFKFCGFVPILLPNDRDVALTVLGDLPIRGLVLTGGDDLAEFGGSSPERDETEFHLLESAIEGGLPIAGICRGMQVIQRRFGVELEPVRNHVQHRIEIETSSGNRVVNSYHTLGARSSNACLPIWARSDDGIVKAVRHAALPIMGIMWHPERQNPFDSEDRVLLRDFFTASSASNSLIGS